MQLKPRSSLSDKGKMRRTGSGIQEISPAMKLRPTRLAVSAVVAATPGSSHRAPPVGKGCGSAFRSCSGRRQGRQQREPRRSRQSRLGIAVAGLHPQAARWPARWKVPARTQPRSSSPSRVDEAWRSSVPGRQPILLS